MQLVVKHFFGTNFTNKIREIRVKIRGKKFNKI